MLPRPHDLLWLRSADDLQGELPDWVGSQWHLGLPVVVRRDSHPGGLIPVGVRGIQRGERAAAWVDAAAIVKQATPESLADSQWLLRSPFALLPQVQGAMALARQPWGWLWGITGSCGFALATAEPVMHGASDLDLIIRADHPLDPQALARWQRVLAELPCRADTQVETPSGAFALNEWLRDARVMLKTDRGPRLTANPWPDRALRDERGGEQ